jgi:multiple sugar transport system ATP-binding protein
MPALSLEHVTRIFPGGIRAVDDLTLDVADGELLVLVGPSGCGKTTILRLIAGLETPTRGTLLIAGRDAAVLSPKDRDVAMVFQQGSLYPHLSVRANLGFGLTMRGEAKAAIDRRVAEAAAVLGIDDLLARRPAELSGGQQQRVALGRAMVRRPRLLLMDEPLSNLEPGLRAQLRHEIRRLHGRLGTATVYVTHDQTEAMSLGHRIAVLRQGRLQQVADPQTIYQRPANRFVAGLIGSPAMNFVEGVYSHESRRWEARSGEWGVECREWEVALSRRPGRNVVLGIRPEHVRLMDGQTPDGACVSAVVEAIERLGPETHVYLRARDDALVSRTDADCSLEVGQRVGLAFSKEHMHFFDSDTGEALS